eukprot:1136274-Pelagomonas_calceolata.AAC.1
MPVPFFRANKEMFQGDVYILVDGDKRVRVHPTNGVKQDCPLCLSLFLLTLMTWAEISVKG